MVHNIGESLPDRDLAQQAWFDYMSQGASLQLAELDVPTARKWLEVTQPGSLPPEKELDIGWLSAEMMLMRASEARNNPETAEGAQAESLAWADRSARHWGSIVQRHAGSVALQSRAMAALGALGPYRVISQLYFDVPGTIDVLGYYAADLEAASLLLGVYDKYRDTSLLRDLHCQTARLLFNYPLDATDGVMLPVPTRLQEEGNDRAVDLLIWQTNGRVFHARTSPEEGGAVNGNATLWPALFKNGDYPSPSKQGTLQAILDQAAGRTGKRDPQLPKRREAHLREVRKNLRDEIWRQTESDPQETLSIDPVTGLGEARRWYESLGPNYRLMKDEAADLEQIITPFEYALSAGDLGYEDMRMLGWLWTEFELHCRKPGGFERAEEVFDAAANMARSDENWPAYYEVLIDRATARFYQHGHEAGDSEELIAGYRDELSDIAQRLLPVIHAPQDNSLGSRLTPIAVRLAASLAACKGDDYIAVHASPRQRGVYDDAAGADLIILPERSEDEATKYSLVGAGKVQFAETADVSTLDRGIATLPARTLYGSGEPDAYALLYTVLAAERPTGPDEEPSAEWAFTEYLRNLLITAAAPTMR